MVFTFNPKRFDDPEFKEDGVREAIIAPMLAKLGYSSDGENRVVYSRTLKHPFIRVGTSNHPVRIVPDYTLLHNERPIFVLDAKAPSEDILSEEHVQQAYSYAIHPEIDCREFGLCNGRRLVMFGVNSASPILDVSFSEFSSRWNEIEKYMAPMFLTRPELRRFSPDLGFKLSRMGFSRGSKITFFPIRLNLFALVREGLYTATSNYEFAGKLHCASFDFTAPILDLIVNGLPEPLRGQFVGALKCAPFMAVAGLAIEFDATVEVGELTQGQEEAFVPLIITEVIESRFNPSDPGEDPNVYPAGVFQFRKAFKIVSSFGEQRRTT